MCGCGDGKFYGCAKYDGSCICGIVGSYVGVGVCIVVVNLIVLV